jgi:UDP-2,4-diacetamido-2,4,6-trideoxy-beta-L-altropyranose hydrolase
VRRAPAPGVLWLRPAGPDDADRVLAWRNDDEAVRWSATHDAVDASEHASWFATLLTDAGRRLMIGEVDGDAVGFVRVDVVDGVGTVSVAVDRAVRGQGIGLGLLRELGDAMRADQQTVALRACVHPDNAASHHIFGAAGFEAVGVEPDTGFTVYRCERAAYPSSAEGVVA